MKKNKEDEEVNDNRNESSGQVENEVNTLKPKLQLKVKELVIHQSIFCTTKVIMKLMIPSI